MNTTTTRNDPTRWRKTGTHHGLVQDNEGEFVLFSDIVDTWRYKTAYEDLKIFVDTEIEAARKERDAAVRHLMEVAGERDRLSVKHDALIERSVAAMSIAEGEDGHETLPIDCPMLQAVATLRSSYDKARADAMRHEKLSRALAIAKNDEVITAYDEALHQLRNEKELSVKDWRKLIGDWRAQAEMNARERDAATASLSEITKERDAAEKSFTAETVRSERLQKEWDEAHAANELLLDDKARLDFLDSLPDGCAFTPSDFGTNIRSAIDCFKKSLIPPPHKQRKATA